MTMTYEQATEQAVKLHNQGMTYPKIEEHFKALGYTSPRTKNAVGSLAIRHMVTQFQLREKAKAVQDTKEDNRVIEVSSPVRDILSAVEKVLDIDGIATSIKLKMVRALIADDHTSTKPTRKVRAKKVPA